MFALVMDTYARAVGDAYSLMLEEFLALQGRHNCTIQPRLTPSGGIGLERGSEVVRVVAEAGITPSQIIGRCGGRVGAAGRRARTSIALAHLDELQELGHDLTATTANRIVMEASGHGIARAARAKYSTPGRAADAKSDILMTPAAAIAVVKIEKDHVRFEVKALQVRFDLSRQWLEKWRKMSVS
ncbi:hypothetical protein [Halomonas sp. I5-271120]|uniref:hypothetical protein n=1 Tax=Halomonas sp. I5-271120 TaxID=3061632 RepID=UPI00271549EE|nr:hypothetical protein [Halomonas sp. I5-271120]